MLKRIIVALAAVAVLLMAAGGLLYQFGGLRVAVDGSGTVPRFVSRVPDFDALEADRARQRAGARPVADPVPATPQPGAGPASGGSPTVGLGAAASTSTAPIATAASFAAPPWPDFRGRNRDGKYDGPPIRTDWPSEGLPLVWKQPIGLGYASFVVADGRAFTIEQRRAQEVAAAYDLKTGRELWIDAWDGEFTESMGGDGPRATPTYHDGRVYALGALGELRSLDARTGAVLWRRNILSDSRADNLDWGMSGAPLIVDDLIIVLPGGRGGRSVVALDRITGEPVWQSLDDRQAYTSPMLVTLAGVRHIVFISATRVVGVAVSDGQLLWEFPWSTQMGINASQPLLLDGDRVFVSSSYGQGAAVFEVTRSADRFSTRQVWANTRMKNRFSSPLLYDGHIYGLDEAILACVDARTGDLEWKAGRYGYGQVLLAGDRLIVLTEQGEVVQVRATPDRHEELARFDAISGKTWNHPVIADGILLVRNLREMAAFDIRR